MTDMKGFSEADRARFASAFGRQGGLARAVKLSRARRVEIARHAAKASAKIRTAKAKTKKGAV